MILITLPDILDFVGESTRPLKEGYLISNSAHILRCGLSRSEEPTFEVFALVLQHSDLKGQPLEVRIHVIRNFQEDPPDVNGSCTCKAGSPKCKHIVGVLMHMQDKDSDDFDHISCTDTVQAWGGFAKHALTAYEPCPLEDLKCHVKPHKKKYKPPPRPEELPDSMRKDLVLTLQSIFPVSMLKKYYNVDGFHSLDRTTWSRPIVLIDSGKPECLPDIVIEEIIGREVPAHINSYLPVLLQCQQELQQYFYTNIASNAYELLNVAKTTVDQSSSPQWLQLRKYRITGSNCYKLYTFATASEKSDDKWDKKLCSILNGSFKGNAATDFGNDHEIIAIKHFIEDRGGKYYRCGLLVNAENPYLGYSPDGFHESDDEMELVLVEVKCPARGQKCNLSEMLQALEFVQLDKITKSYTLRKHHHYYGQVQLGLFITALRSCLFILYNKYEDKNYYIRVEADDEFTTALVDTLTSVYFQRYLPYLHKFKY